jgi:type I restriction enzyme R subunit
MTFLNEQAVEGLLLDAFVDLGYERQSDKLIGPDGACAERTSHNDVILMGRLRAAVARLNPNLPVPVREEAIRKLTLVDRPSLLEENRRLHRALVEGVKVEYRDAEGRTSYPAVRLIDFEDPENNDWLVVDQFTLVENSNKRRPDVVVFVNGLPLAVVELKNPTAEQATLTSAFNQLQTYKSEIPTLFRTNAALVITDGMRARVGSLTANEERFMPWRTVDGVEAPEHAPEVSTLIAGVFEKRRLLELIRDFTLFLDTGAGVVKILAGYHQYHAVKHAVEKTIEATAPEGDRRVGVIWHTQGSGKSLLMAFYAGQLVTHPALSNPTIVVITDRNDLDDQLFGTFAGAQELIRQAPAQADSREELMRALERASGGVVFTTIQKFAPPAGHSDYPVLTDRRNVVVIADEAHRSQYGFRARVEQRTGDISYGFAKYLRDALPNASFIGFTGTPIEKDDVNTPAVFGDYIDIYDISRAVEDGATVPIYYESRLARIELPEEERPKVDAEIEALTEDEALTDAERLKQKWATVEALVGSKKRLELVAKDLVEHFEKRVMALDGKAMVVTMSRRICVALYDEITKLRPEWHNEDPSKGVIKVVMTGSASDPPAWQQHIGNKARRDLIAKRAKDPNDELRLVIVRDMWLTGFDAPAMHTMYVDKPMRGHGLMQAIARVNRVFKDKPAGLVVDYIGIAQSLKQALSQYTPQDQRQTGVNQAEAVAVMLEKLDVVRSLFHGFDYTGIETATSAQRLTLLANAVDFIQRKQHEQAICEDTDEAKKRAHRRYQDAVLALTKAHALAAASDEAAQVSIEVGFFQAVRSVLIKTDPRTSSAADRELAVRQIIDRAVTSTEIVDILAAVGIDTPDIGILSEQFLAEMQQMEQKNLALEALKKLLNDEIRSRTKTNVIEGKRFSERLQNAINRYHTNAVTTVEVIQEMIDMAKDLKAAREREQDSGMTPDEVAFYDALAENESAVQVLGNDELRVIAQLVLEALKKNVTVDWARRETVRARLRVLIKDILEDHGYPPDLSREAVHNVLLQAEQLSAQWASAGN